MKKALAILSIVILLGSVSYLGNWLYKVRSRSAKSGYEIAKQARTERQIQQLEAAKLSAQHLRGDWELWARNHKSQIGRLGRPSADGGSFETIWNALPTKLTNHEETGLTYAELRSGPIRFSWQPSAKNRDILLPRPEMRRSFEQGIDSVERGSRKRFAQYHDIEISRSVSSGPTQVTLWASGRITETTLIQQNIPGKPTFVEGPPVEIAPPYDFIN